METSKARERRVREGFFITYCKGSGLDIGCGDDPLATPYGTVTPYDRIDGDATFIDKFEERFDFVYSSHCLEHLQEPEIALRSWYDQVKTNGFLIVCIPHRDLYEKKKFLPSNFNTDHKSFWLPEKSDNKDTYGVREFVNKVLKDCDYSWERLKVCDEGYKSYSPESHSDGEYQIEFIIQRLD